MGYTQIESSAEYLLAILKIINAPEIVPQPQRNSGKINSAVTASAIKHLIVS